MAIQRMGEQEGPWYKHVNPYQWKVLLVSFLGWIFDGYEGYVISLAMAPILTSLIPHANVETIGYYGGILMSVMLLGWATGGIVGGVLADYIGRRKTMILTILVYALSTFVTGLATSFLQICIFRFITGLGIGGEWSTGTSMIAETWPEKARSKGQGIMQSGYGFGQFLGAFIWLIISMSFGANGWRFLFFVGVIPALMTLYLRRGIKESERWERANEKRNKLKENYQGLSAEEKIETSFSLKYIFSVPKYRKRTLLAFGLSLSTTLGYWGSSSFIPTYMGSLAKNAGLPNPASYSGTSGMYYSAGAILGYLIFGLIVDKFGRRWSIALYYFFSLLIIPTVFLWVHDITILMPLVLVNGFFTLGQFSWNPVYIPELYPTQVRSTAASFIFNASRYVSAIGPFVAGTIVARAGGFGYAASIVALFYFVGLICLPFLPETKGQPLPE
ncbi:putative sialic acid transporter [Peptococcaceae bacterium CEB3]|nr:putative sialic acid transporter [Peptococcaceae bacterium CEB3]